MCHCIVVEHPSGGGVRVWLQQGPCGQGHRWAQRWEPA